MNLSAQAASISLANNMLWMKTPDMPSLEEIIEQQNGGAPASGETTPAASGVTPQPPPAAGSATATPTASPPVPAVAPAADSSAAPSQPEANQPQFSLLSQMQEAGIDTAGFADDQEAFSAFMGALTETSEQLHSPEYQEFLEQRAKAQAAPKQPEQVTPPSPEPKKAASPMDLPEVSSTAQMLRQNEVLSRNANGVWESKDPNLQSYAKELNDYDLAFQARSRAMLADPTPFLEPIVQSQVDSLVEARVQSTLENLGLSKDLVERLTNVEAVQQQALAAKEQKKIEAFRKDSGVFDSAGKLTPYGEKLKRLDANIAKNQPNLSDAQRLDEVMKLATDLGITPEASAPATPQETPAQPEQKSFVDAAGSATGETNGAPTNRLKEFAGQMPSKQPKSLKDASGFPDLEAHIANNSKTLT